jgi:hypothetical protein
MKIDQRRLGEIARVIQQYEPEAFAALVRKPGSLLPVLLEAGRRVLRATAPGIASDERERIDAYIISRMEGLDEHDAYENGKAMAFLSIRQFLKEKEYE